MSAHQKGNIRARKAQVAIADYLVVKPGTASDEVTLAVLNDKGDGVAQVQSQLNPPGAGDTIEVCDNGGGYVRLGGTVTRGASLMPNDDSKAIAATTGKWAFGVADEDGDANDVIAYRTFIHQLA